ncbi:M23 family metallopeptidase [Candidatus Finniella inopinata]|nr:M23 family metallopeptidase [Candidatus Finniella inopinata]
MLKKLSIFCLSLLMIAGCSRDEPPSEVVYSRPLNPYHVVKTGETTLIVAQKYGMNEDELIKINRLRSPYKLVPGQRLLVHRKATGSDAPPASAPEGDVVVKPLDAPVDAAVAVGSGAGAVVSMPTATGKSNLTTDAPTVTDEVPSSSASPAGGDYVWPVQGKVIQAFGPKPDGTFSDGINISAPGKTPVKALTDGVVKDAGEPIAAYGKMVVVKHDDGKFSIYAHLSEIAVKQGAKVSKGQIIGRVGDTGIAKNNPQLYLQIRDASKKTIDPAKLLP